MRGTKEQERRERGRRKGEEKNRSDNTNKYALIKNSLNLLTQK
jgi:hypothetical protein